VIILNNELIEIGTFPNGELTIKSTLDKCYAYRNELVFKWVNDISLIKLMLVTKQLKHSFPNMSLSLKILYMPYSRMDRDIEGTSNCSLRYIGEFIQSLGFDEITVLDPHSDLTLAYLGTNSRYVYPFIQQDLQKESISPENYIIMFPDAGAQKRYGSMELFKAYQQIVGFKERDFKTGNITNFKLVGSLLVTDYNVLIVDDLCSKGTTFLFAANSLKEYGFKNISLLVTHCEDTIFNGELLKDSSPINTIYTTNTVLTKVHSKFKVMEVFTYGN
jgi:ribose-phosphate pyrophosphokinase